MWHSNPSDKLQYFFRTTIDHQYILYLQVANYWSCSCSQSNMTQNQKIQLYLYIETFENQTEHYNITNFITPFPVQVCRKVFRLVCVKYAIPSKILRCRSCAHCSSKRISQTRQIWLEFQDGRFSILKQKQVTTHFILKTCAHLVSPFAPESMSCAHSWSVENNPIKMK